MILETVAIVSAFGIILFVIGLGTDHPEFTMVGAIVIMGIGAVGMVNGFQVQSGQTVTTTTNKISVASKNIGNASLIHTLDVTSQDTAPTGVSFNANGSNMYISGSSSAAIYSYDTGLYDLSLATYRNTFDVSAQDSDPVDVEFNPNGTRMYVVGGTNAAIYEYLLSTPFNITSATYQRNISVSANAAAPRAMAMSDAGQKLYVVGSTNAVIAEYTMSDPYNISSASYLKNFSVSSQETTPTGLDFSANGKLMFITGETSKTIYQYKLTSAYNLDTASYTGHSYDVSSHANRPSAVAYENDGKMTFISDRQSGTLDEFKTSDQVDQQSTVKNTTYTDIQSISKFPIPVVVLLIGFIMFVAGTTGASKL